VDGPGTSMIFKLVFQLTEVPAKNQNYC